MTCNPIVLCAQKFKMRRHLADAMRASSKLPVVLMAMLFSLSAAADPDTEKSTESAASEWKLDTIYRLEGTYNTVHNEAQKLDLTVEPQISRKLPGGADFVGMARLRGDVFDRLEPGTPTGGARSPISNRWTPNPHVDAELRELYVKFNAGDSLVTVGKQQVVWGNADGLRILDVVDPFSFREFVLEDFDRARIPRWTANAQIPIGAANLQLLWLPDPTFNEFPDPGSAYEITSVLYTPPAPPPGVNVIQRPIERPNNYLSDSDFGMRLSGNWNGWDLTANYLYHYDPNPIVFRTLLETLAPTVLVEQKFRRSHLVGGTFSNAFGSLVIRGEGGVNFNRYFLRNQIGDSQGLVKTNELSYVIGLDWTKISHTLISGQLFQSRILGGAEDLVRNRVDTVASLLVRRDFAQQTWTGEMLWLHNLNYNDGLVRPRLRHNLRDNLNLWAGADIFYGQSTRAFGQFEHTNRVVFGIEWRN